MLDKLPKFSRDSSYKRRGGSAKWLLLSCGICKEGFSLYQKDGPGKLHRLYLDRLASTSGERPFKDLGKTAISQLECDSCGVVIATPMTYEKDDFPRTALRLVEAGVNQAVLQQKDFQAMDPINVTQTMHSIVKGTAATA